MLPCKYLHALLFPPHPIHWMLSLSTCSLIPLLAAGQQVNWYPPPHRRWGSTLMKLCLGAPVLAGDTHGVMISSVAPSHRIWLPQSSPGCLLMLTGPSQFNTAQQVRGHTDWQCGDTNTSAHESGELFPEAYARTHRVQVCGHVLIWEFALRRRSTEAPTQPYLFYMLLC